MPGKHITLKLGKN